MHDQNLSMSSDAFKQAVAAEVEKAVAAEREACAQIADVWATSEQRQLGLGPAAAIRARSRPTSAGMEEANVSEVAKEQMVDPDHYPEELLNLDAPATQPKVVHTEDHTADDEVFATI